MEEMLPNFMRVTEMSVRAINLNSDIPIRDEEMLYHNPKDQGKGQNTNVFAEFKDDCVYGRVRAGISDSG